MATRPGFAARRTTALIDGRTPAELKTLRTCERLPRPPPAGVAFDGQRVRRAGSGSHLRPGDRAGIYPQTPHRGYFAAIGLAIDVSLAAHLHDTGWDAAGAIQCSGWRTCAGWRG